MAFRRITFKELDRVFDEINGKLMVYEQQVRLFGTQATKENAEKLLALANQGVPREGGILEKSGFVEFALTSRGNPSYRVYYNTIKAGGDATWKGVDFNYAVIQHEDMSLNHPHGGHAKWLYRAYENMHYDMINNVVKATREATRKTFG